MRTPLFQRKGAGGSAAPDAAPSQPPGDQSGPDAQTGDDAGAGAVVTCPQCGCQFDPAEQPSPDAGADAGAPPDVSQVAAMLGMGGGGAPVGAG